MRLISAAFALSALLMAPALPHAQEVPSPVVVIDTGQRTWRIPYLYLSIRPPPGPLPTVARVPGFSFSFWMPTGRPSTIAGHEAASPRPHEPGRAPAGEDDYLIIGTDVRDWTDPDAETRPALALDNVISDGSENYEFRKRWDLLEITARTGRPSVRDYYYGTRLLREPRLIRASALVSCPRPGTPGNNEHSINRLCSGRVALSRLDVVFHIRVPLERMDQLMDAVGVAARLLGDWADPSSLRR